MRQPSEQPHERRPRPPFPPQRQDKPGLEKRLRPRPQYQACDYRAAGKLRGQVALITGGDSGIGRAVAKAAAQYGKVTILVNNAAYQQSQARFEDITDEQLDTTLRTNICGYFHMARAALRRMGAGAAIINCGSVAGLRGSKTLVDYSATKGAIDSFTKSLAANLIERGIRVNCVAPGPVWTPLNPADRPASEIAHFGEKAPMGRPGQPDEIAPAFVFFASAADSSYVSGEVLAIQGGEAM